MSEIERGEREERKIARGDVKLDAYSYVSLLHNNPPPAPPVSLRPLLSVNLKRTHMCTYIEIGRLCPRVLVRAQAPPLTPKVGTSGKRERKCVRMCENKKRTNRGQTE